MTPRRIVDDIALCLVFFTRLPLPRLEFGARTLGEAIWAAPVAGLAVGLAGGLVYVVMVWLGVSFLIAGALALATTMLASGCLHEDGLSDVADGFGGGATSERKLEIMRDSRIGAYGASALLMSMLLRWSALISLVGPSLTFWSLIAAHIASRALIPAFMHIMPPARTDGLAAGAGKVGANTAYAALAIGAAVLIACLGLTAAIIAAIVLALVFFAFRALCLRQIGGQTGDTLGALQQLGEIAVLVVAATVLT
ncbi:MAG: adenosylcobinamide-GDP ribazoletransferase [Mesorhizobium sp.]|nr:adenosylcobinamide-GDP ribazoletransferase [Mesorhizobium sp.]MBL8575947.1 adenosylcobinamide-GDP ribazoletransferase [Mesorhizobium sp.]